MVTTCAIGLMSGTSMDGIDLALLRSDGEQLVERGPSLFAAYDAAFRARLEQAMRDAVAITQRHDRPGILPEVEQEITRRHADAVAKLRHEIAGGAWQPELIGFHGQTVLHRPEAGLTVQLGDGPLLARLTGCPVIYDMRANDMLHGGQGAPLVPVYHAALAATLPGALSGRFPVVFVNIGGIANVTFIPRAGDPVAFDCGPGNALIDRWVLREGGVAFDADGAIAGQGRVVSAVVERYMANPFLAVSGPKSLDRHDFTLDEAAGLGLADGARTLAAVTAGAIVKSVRHMPARPCLWIVCGGGRKNPHILADLRAGVGDGEVIVAEQAGLDGDAMEAEAWAYLAVRSRRGLALTFPGTTGCRRAVTGGLSTV